MISSFSLRLMLSAIATILAINTAFKAQADSASIAVPPIYEFTPQTQALPRILSEADDDRYRAIFAVQEKGDWKEADRLIGDLDDPVLMGHVLFQRYMHPTLWRSRYAELKDWLNLYADHPDARRIYALAKRRQGKAASPRAPLPNRGVYGKSEAQSSRPVAPKRSKADRKTVRDFKATLERDVRRRNADRAEKRYWAMERLDMLTPYEAAQALGRVVFAHFMAGHDEKAAALADMASALAPTLAHDANWFGGLAAWRLGDFEKATALFTRLAQATDADPWQRAAGGVWGARAALACGEMLSVSRLLIQAAQENETFYGLIAARQLGLHNGHDWRIPAIDPRTRDSLLAMPAVRRAIALTEIGKSQLADEEIRLALGRTESDLWPALAALSAHLHLPGSQLRLANVLTEQPMPTALYYPLPDWVPEDGFMVDRAMIFAIIRQESKFSNVARSHKGASGLMQIMPSTASYIMGDASLRRQRDRLYDPAYNMSVGQHYIDYLARHPAVEGNLLMMTVAYNAGPGNLARWQKTVDYRNDPLLFIEALPSQETRVYVERVLANLWLYRMQLGQETPTLDAMAAGEWPGYPRLDSNETAQHNEMGGNWEKGLADAGN